MEYKGSGIYSTEDFVFISACDIAPENLEEDTCFIADKFDWQELLQNSECEI